MATPPYNKSLNMFGDMTDDETLNAYPCSMVDPPPHDTAVPET